MSRQIEGGESGIVVCPICGSVEIESSDVQWDCPTRGTVTTSCQDCETEWLETFELQKVELLAERGELV